MTSAFGRSSEQASREEEEEPRPPPDHSHILHHHHVAGLRNRKIWFGGHDESKRLKLGRHVQLAAGAAAAYWGAWAAWG